MRKITVKERDAKLKKTFFRRQSISVNTLPQSNNQAQNLDKAESSKYIEQKTGLQKSERNETSLLNRVITKKKTTQKLTVFSNKMVIGKDKQVRFLIAANNRDSADDQYEVNREILKTNQLFDDNIGANALYEAAQQYLDIDDDRKNTRNKSLNNMIDNKNIEITDSIQQQKDQNIDEKNSILKKKDSKRSDNCSLDDIIERRVAVTFREQGKDGNQKNKKKYNKYARETSLQSFKNTSIKTKKANVLSITRLKQLIQYKWVQKWVQIYWKVRDAFLNQKRADEVLIDLVTKYELLSELLLSKYIDIELANQADPILERFNNPKFRQLRAKCGGNKLIIEQFQSLFQDIEECLKLKRIDNMSEVYNSVRQQRFYVIKNAIKYHRKGLLFRTRNLRLTHFGEKVTKYERDFGEFQLISLITRKMQSTMNFQTERINPFKNQ